MDAYLVNLNIKVEGFEKNNKSIVFADCDLKARYMVLMEECHNREVTLKQDRIDVEAAAANPATILEDDIFNYRAESCTKLRISKACVNGKPMNIILDDNIDILIQHQNAVAGELMKVYKCNLKWNIESYEKSIEVLVKAQSKQAAATTALLNEFHDLNGSEDDATIIKAIEDYVTDFYNGDYSIDGIEDSSGNYSIDGIEALETVEVMIDSHITNRVIEPSKISLPAVISYAA